MITKPSLIKCKKDLLSLEAYSRREIVKILAVPESTGNENASEPEDTNTIVYSFLEHESQIENPRAKYEFQRVHCLGKPNSTSSRPIIVRFFTIHQQGRSFERGPKEIKGQGLFYVRRHPKRSVRPS